MPSFPRMMRVVIVAGAGVTLPLLALAQGTPPQSPLQAPVPEQPKVSPETPVAAATASPPVAKRIEPMVAPIRRVIPPGRRGVAGSPAVRRDAGATGPRRSRPPARGAALNLPPAQGLGAGPIPPVGRIPASTRSAPRAGVRACLPGEIKARRLGICAVRAATPANVPPRLPRSAARR